MFRMPHPGSLHRRALLGAACLVTLVACGEQQTPMEPEVPDPPDEPGVATQLVFDVQPGDGTAGTPLAPSIEVAFQDNQGAVVTSAAGAVTVELSTNPAGGTLAGTLTVNAANGVATFADLTIDRAAAGYTLTARSGNLASAASVAFAIAAGAPAQLVFQTPPSDVDLDVVLAPAIEVVVQDGLGNVVPSAAVDVTLRLDANPGGATLGGTSTVAAVNGVATFGDLTVDRAGSGYTLAAAAVDLVSAVSPAFEVVFAFTQLSGSIDLLDIQDHTCGVTTSGAVYCWGANFYGQLGDGNSGTDSDAPVRVLGGHRFARVAAGLGHTCGLTTDGDAYCWGYNVSGQLGDGNLGTDSDTPVLVQGGHTFVSLDAGSAHACALNTEGVAGCWGNNQAGQLGDGNGGTDSPIPVLVDGGHTFVALAAGGTHTCGVTTEGIAGCWGSSEFGQLGDGSVATGTDTPSLVLGGHSFTSLAAGGFHTCGVTTSGDGYCWGLNDSGQLGDGTGAQQSEPALVRGGHTFAGLTAGTVHTCGLTIDGNAACWGDNTFGELGDANPGVDSDTPVLVLSAHPFASVAAGSFHSCGVTSDRAAYCWGRNNFGQLGDGNGGVDRSTPVAVSNP